MRKVFLDTDVLIDFLVNLQPYNKHAQLIFGLADRGEVQLLVSTLSIANAHYILTRALSSPDATDLVSQTMPFIELCDFQASDVTQALTLQFKDFEDAIQYSLAVRERAGTIISRNIKDYTKSLIPVLSPEVFLQTFQS